MSYVLVKLDTNYADEFNVESFVVVDTDRYNEWRTRVEHTKSFPGEFYFGTNEFLDFYTAEELFSAIEVTPLTEVEAKILEKYFPYIWKDNELGIIASLGYTGFYDADAFYPGFTDIEEF